MSKRSLHFFHCTLFWRGVGDQITVKSMQHVCGSYTLFLIQIIHRGMKKNMCTAGYTETKLKTKKPFIEYECSVMNDNQFSVIDRL